MRSRPPQAAGLPERNRRAHLLPTRESASPKESFYLLSPTSTPAVLKESLSLAYGEAGSISKHRTLFLIGRTRVHLDRVEGLGHFLELEVVLGENETSELATLEARDLMSELGVESHRLLEGAYVELLSESI